jgi:hypothetical protein
MEDHFPFDTEKTGQSLRSARSSRRQSPLDFIDEICVRAARTHFVRTLARTEVFLARMRSVPKII